MAGGKAFDPAAFFVATQRATAHHPVDGFGDVVIQALTIGERQEMATRFEESAADAIAWIVCRGMVDLSDVNLDAVRGMNADTLQAISGAILDLSGLTEGATGDAKND